MTFSPDQKQALAAPLDRSHVTQREQSGQKLSYLEAWHVIAEANRIFGFDGWTRETVECRCVADHERKIGRNKDRDGFGVSYVARVRVTVAGIVREGTGAGHGIDADRGLAHESAIKEAESDAMKRALMTFGNPFGLALYDKSQANVATAPPAPVPVIDDVQFAEIVALAAAAGVPVARILETARVPTLKDLPAADFEAVRKKLNLTIDQNTARKEAA